MAASPFEDDGITLDFEKGKYNNVNLSYGNGKGVMSRSGSFKANRFHIKKWEVIN